MWTKRGTRNKFVVIGILIAALVLFGAYFAFSGHNFFALAPPSVQGVSILGLSNVAIISNLPGVSGTNWWLATALLGGSQTLNAQNPGGQSGPASSFSPNSSYICGSSCQSDNLQISQLYSYLLYPAQSSGVPVLDYNVSYLGDGKQIQINYQTCYGGPLYGTSGMPNTYNYSNQLVNFGGCANGAAQKQAYSNYYNACSSLGGTPLIKQTSSSTTLFTVNLGFFGIPITVYNGDTVGCYQLNAEAYATVYGLQSAIPKYKVKVVFNGQTSTVNDTQSDNASNPNLILYNIGSGFTAQTAPSETTVAVVQYFSINRISIVGGSGTGIASEESAADTGVNSYFPHAYTLANASNYIRSADQQIGSYLTNSYVNTQFSNATVVLANGAPSAVRLNDPAYIYTRPEVVMAIKASLVGLYLGISQINITSVQIVPFRSGSQGTAYVQIKNTGGASGGYTITPSSSNPSVSITPSYQTGTLNSQQGQTLTYSITDNQGISSNSSEPIMFTACPNPQLSGSTCTTVSTSFTLVPACQNNQNYNAGTCQALTTVAPPTTVIPGQPGSNSTTTILPCNVQTGANCPTGSSSNGLPSWVWPAIAVFAIAVIALVLYSRRSGGKSKGKGKPLKIDSKVIIAVIVFAGFVVAIITGYLFWIIIGAVALFGIYALAKFKGITLFKLG